MLRRSDEGMTHTLEAMIIASIMVAAVAFVATFQDPPAPTQGARGVLEAHSRDVLSILGDEPVINSAYGTNLMSVALMECLQNNCTRLNDKMESLLPTGASYALYMSNGYGSFPIYAPRGPPGEAVASEHLFEPAWSYAFMGSAVSSLNPAEDPMVFYVVPVVNSNVVAPQGNVLDVVMHGTRSGDSADYILRTSVATRAVPLASSAYTPAASLYFVDGAGTALASLDARSTTTLAGVATKSPLALTVRLNETAGVALPVGTNVSVHMPRGWNGSASAALNAADWTIVTTAPDYNASSVGSDIVATLTHTLSNAKADLKLNATYNGDQDDYYPFHAVTSQGAYATAALLVQADNHATKPSFEAPDLLVSAPKPMGATATTTWTLTGFIPETPSVTLSDSVTVTRIDVTEERGAAIFGSVTGVSNAGGSWTTNGSALTWTGNATLAHWSPLNLTFRVTPSGTAGSAVEAPPISPAVKLNGWTARVDEATSPGVYRASLLPSDSTYNGYDSSTGGWLLGNHTATSVSSYHGVALPGTLNYSSGYVTGMKDSVFGSDLAVSSRFVSIGSNVTAAANVQSLAYQLAELGFKPIIKLNVYPPWAGDNRTPIYSTTLYDAPAVLGGTPFMSLIDSNGDGTPEPSAIGRYNATIPVPMSWLFGAYILDAEVDWTDSMSATIGGKAVTAPVVRSAHVYDHFMVTAPNGLTPASPVYDVKLLTWFDDWR